MSIQYAPLNGTPAAADTAELRCVNCKSTEILQDYQQGVNVCSECGFIVPGAVISEGTEWRSFADSHSNKGDPNRVGGPEDELYGDVSAGTIIGGGGAFGKIHNRAMMDSKQRAVNEGFQRIDAMQNINMVVINPQAIRRAKEIYKAVVESGKIKNKKVDILSAACVYLATRIFGPSVPFQQFCLHHDVSFRLVGKQFKVIKELKLHKVKSSGNAASACTAANSTTFIDGFCAKLGLPRKIGEAATSIAQSVIKKLIVSAKPSTEAAACIYMASLASPEQQHRRSLEEIAEVSSTSSSTIQSFYTSNLYPNRHDFVPKDFSTAQLVQQLPNC